MQWGLWVFSDSISTKKTKYGWFFDFSYKKKTLKFQRFIQKGFSFHSVSVRANVDYLTFQKPLFPGLIDPFSFDDLELSGEVYAGA